MTDDDYERRLEQVLRSEGDTVQPMGDGLQAIREKIDHRRARRWRLLPVVGAAGVAAAGAVAFALVVNLGAASDPRPVGTGTATSTSVATTSPATSAPAEPFLAIWPITFDGQLSDLDEPWMHQPEEVALKFVDFYDGDIKNLGAPEVMDEVVIADGVATVTVSRKYDNGTYNPISIVKLRTWPGTDKWTVVGAEAGKYAGVTSVVPGGSVASGQVIEGRHHSTGSHELLVVAGAEPLPLHRVRVTAKDNDTWAAKVEFETKATNGALVVRENSEGDGGIGTLTATPVVFTKKTDAPPTATPSPTPEESNALGLPGHMTTFVGVKDNRIAVFGTISGQVKRFLTDAQPADASVQAVSLSADRKWVYFIRGSGACSATDLMRVPFPNGSDAQVETVRTPEDGHRILAMSAGSRDAVTWTETPCFEGGSGALWWHLGDSEPVSVDLPRADMYGSPRLSRDGATVAANLTSTSSSSDAVASEDRLVAFDTRSGEKLPSESLCAQCDLFDFDFDVDPGGTLVGLDGDAAIVRVATGKSEAKPLFGSESRLGVRIDMSKDGTGVLTFDPETGSVTFFRLYADRAVPLDLTHEGISFPSW